MNTKQKQKILDKFLWNNGCGVEIDYKNNNIKIPDGGLWGVEKDFLKCKKIVGYKKREDGMVEVIFSKKKNHKIETYNVIIWIQELRETINYLKRLEKVLNKMGYSTSREADYGKLILRKKPTRKRAKVS